MIGTDAHEKTAEVGRGKIGVRGPESRGVNLKIDEEVTVEMKANGITVDTIVQQETASDFRTFSLFNRCMKHPSRVKLQIFKTFLPKNYSGKHPCVSQRLKD